MGKIKDIDRWRTEIQTAVDFREREFGKFERDKIEGVGQNIKYFENGFYTGLPDSDDMFTTINIVDAIVSVIVPSLYFKNPKSIVTPNKIEAEDTAPLVSKILDYYRRKMETEEINQRIIWDAYVLGMGVYKIGYATKFGKDIPDKPKEKKSVVDKGLEAIGLKEREVEEVTHPEIDQRIISESPYIEYISPFDFIMDPRATNINDAMWWGHRIRKTVKELKSNSKYKNTKNLQGTLPEVSSMSGERVSETDIDEFKTVYLYEIHYRNDNEYYLLNLTEDEGDEWREQYHEVSPYKLGEWQADILNFKKHSHSQFAKSDITKIINLQDRITNTIDAILEQVDKFVPKLAYDQGKVDKTSGVNALKNGDIGALVACNGNPGEVFKELNFTQLKTDLQALIDQLISLISIQTGITRAQLTGVSRSGTATEATIEQGGQTLRLSDMTGSVERFAARQTRKLWKVVRQFVDLEDLELINGVKGIDQETGLPKYDWLTVNEQSAEKMQTGDYDFNIEVGSTQKINLSLIRKQFENLFNILARTEVVGLMQQQGDKLQLSELLKKYLDQFPEIGMDSGKIIQKITQETTGLVSTDQEQRGGTTQGSNTNELRRQQAEAAPTVPQALSEGAQV